MIDAEVPGVEPDDVAVTVEDNVLTISGSFEERSESEDSKYVRRELHKGSFERKLQLGPTVDPEGIEAASKNGILTLTIPKASAAKPRTIEVQASS